MATSQLTRSRRTSGFSLIEILVAILVLTTGLSAMAALSARSLRGTDQARQMAVSTTLCSEKLEDLNRWVKADPHVAAGGSLTSDNTVGTLNYYDDVDLSNTTGQVSETMAITGGYSSVIHKSTGEVIANSNTAAPSGAVAFHRRWLIEADPTVNGITLTGSRRVTVIVTGSNLGVGPANSFQISAIRP
jgi:prepilin-type N-terminal cleavage/methylation domain-containing protein